ncbi:hypothetical protein E2I00_016971, partial [Balaenoptera physalus]
NPDLWPGFRSPIEEELTSFKNSGRVNLGGRSANTCQELRCVSRDHYFFNRCTNRLELHLTRCSILYSFSGNFTNSCSDMCLDACFQVGGIAQGPGLGCRDLPMRED